MEGKETSRTPFHPPGAPSAGEVIHVDCASHVYTDGTVGIHRMCFRVLEREIVALCGGNGAGKSTLIEHLNGLLSPQEGSVTVLGRPVEAGRSAGLWKLVGVVFQRAEDQVFAPTVLDDVMFGPLNLGMEPEKAREAALRALSQVGAEPLAGRMPAYLSGGEMRLVAIAGILAMEPRVVALDEPTADLDPLHSEMMERVILDLKNLHGMSVVLATHDLDFAGRVADRICLVREGSILAEGSPRDILYNGDLLSRAGLKKPAVPAVYSGICEKLGIPLTARPITGEELVASLAGGAGGEFPPAPARPP